MKERRYKLALVVPKAELSKWLPLLRGLGLGHEGINLPRARLHRLLGGKIHWNTGGSSELAFIVIVKDFTREEFEHEDERVRSPLVALSDSGVPLSGVLMAILDEKNRVVSAKRLEEQH